eukprot:NODE_836_length_2740_cov_14.357061.p1 GENE.NODE_836_length_2740_cov_14.357061~~NODE_836_length_2740_cov_14.357061.p1  ORF type:complete len:461 (+),score=134.80 NODE_836_length_2740_cov_14.357061:158-1540(+)
MMFKSGRLAVLGSFALAFSVLILCWEFTAVRNLAEEALGGVDEADAPGGGGGGGSVGRGGGSHRHFDGRETADRGVKVMGEHDKFLPKSAPRLPAALPVEDSAAEGLAKAPPDEGSSTAVALPLLPSFPMPPEVRDPKCIGRSFDRRALPSVAMVIPYLNETIVQIQATLASVFTLTPVELLDVVLMIDDGNTEDWQHHNQLRAIHPKVRVLRNEVRQGLIRSKVIGAAAVESPVIIFMEPHCVVSREWLEPLLQRMMLSKDHNLVAVPVLDVIPENDFTKYVAARYHTGGFNWKLEFNWKKTIDQRNHSYRLPDPYPTPALSGGIFAIWRDFWEKSGTYDMKMTEWGGEHIEMSLRTWRCGGSIEIVPCSRIGHVFRAKNPYVVHHMALFRNTKRVALVWLDEYLETFYSQLEMMRNLDAGDVQERLDVIQQLHCKSMEWYLDNVYPELRDELQKLDSN